MRGAIPPHPQYTFMVCCSFKNAQELYLYLALRQPQSVRYKTRGKINFTYGVESSLSYKRITTQSGFWVDYFKIFSWHSHGFAFENHKKPQSRYLCVFLEYTVSVLQANGPTSVLINWRKLSVKFWRVSDFCSTALMDSVMTPWAFLCAWFRLHIGAWNSIVTVMAPYKLRPVNIWVIVISQISRILFSSFVSSKRVYPKVSGLAARSENCRWYSSLPLGAVVSLFREPV